MQNCSDQFLDVTVEDINTNESDEVNDDEDIEPSDVDEYVFVKKSTTVKSGKNKGKEKCVVSLVSCNFTFKRKFTSKNEICIFSCNGCQKLGVNINAKAIEENDDFTLIYVPKFTEHSCCPSGVEVLLNLWVKSTKPTLGTPTPRATSVSLTGWL